MACRFLWVVTTTWLFILYPFSAFSQKRTVVEKFVIEHAKYNKHDSSFYYIDNKAYLSLYQTDKGDSLQFSLGFDKEELFTRAGKIFDLRAKFYDKTEKAHQAEFITFRWNYRNPDSSDEDTAFVQIWRVYKTRGVTFECWILFRDGVIIDLEGFIDHPVTDVKASYGIKPSMFVKGKE